MTSGQDPPRGPAPPRPDLPRAVAAAPGSPPERPDAAPLPPAEWHPVEAIPVLVIAVIAISLLSAPSILTEDRRLRYLAAAIATPIGFASAVLFWVRVVHDAPLATLGLPREPRRDVLAGLVAGVTVVVAGIVGSVVVTAVATAVLGHEPNVHQVPLYVRGPILGLFGPTVVLLVPVGEELFFRGFVYRSLRSRFPLWPSVVVSALVFGLFHLLGGLSLWPLVPPLALVGAGLALVYDRRKSLLASMTAHAVFNLVGFIAIVLSRR